MVANKNALVFCVMTLVVLASLLAFPATALDPFVGLSVGGTRKRASSDLECCNNCSCQPPWRWCTCEDLNEYEVGCTPGCYDCRCDTRRYPSCICADMLDYCPDLCGFKSLGTTSTQPTTASSSTPS